jgi:thioredoxin reductase/Fe-S-cluster-containing hydrogenase component 2/CRP-like cAMP-binding protein
MTDAPDKYKIAIIGSGPGGLSAATHAAELGVSHVLLESEPAPANTVRKFQRGKHVMAEPNHIPLRSALSFSAGSREKVLKSWEDELVLKGVNLHLNSKVTSISGGRGEFIIETASGAVIEAESVILAIGLQGNIRKLGVPGEELPMVQYQLDDPDAFVDETIVVVGAGDAGVENALALMHRNRVILLNRDKEFTRCNEENRALLQEAEEGFIIETWLNSRIEQAVAIKEGGFSLMLAVRTPDGTEKIACHRVIARLGADPPRKLVESFGVRFPSADASSIPQLSTAFESNVPGLYIVGALAGFPLIKQAMNQGYDAVEHILGNAVESADEALLKEKLSGVPSGSASEEKLAYIRRCVPLLAGLTPLQLREFMLESNVLKPRPDEFIFRHNDYNTAFFTIVHGGVTLLAENKASSLDLGAGDFFGEAGLLSGRSTSEAARAGNHCLLIETPRRAMLNLAERVGSVREMLHEKALERAIQGFFELPLPKDDMDFLVHAAQPLGFETGDILFKTGDMVSGLYIIKQGSVTISRAGVTLALVTAGHYAGAMELISGAPSVNQAQAAMTTEAVLIESRFIFEVLSRNASLRYLLDERYLQHMRREEGGLIGNSAISDPEAHPSQSSEIVQFLLRQGIGEATDMLLIDYSLCIRCDSCEKACAETHGGTSRLDREAGTTYANIHIPTSCRHCEHPHCMKDCPPDAIRRSVNGEVYISDSCIGCGNCVRNCPYDVIQLSSASSSYRRSGFASFLAGLLTGNDITPPSEAGDLSKKAVKCDMCNNFRDGPACVRACPTGAAFRFRPEQLLSGPP